MRDIRDDLHERLNFLDIRYADVMRDFDERRALLDLDFRTALGDLTRERDALSALLALENRKVPEGSEEHTKPRVLAPLSDFLITLAASYGAVRKDQLRAEADAAGYPEAKNGRSFHFVLMNIAKAHKLHQLPDGRYAHPNSPQPLSGLFGMNGLDGQDREVEVRTVM